MRIVHLLLIKWAKWGEVLSFKPVLCYMRANAIYASVFYILIYPCFVWKCIPADWPAVATDCTAPLVAPAGENSAVCGVAQAFKMPPVSKICTRWSDRPCGWRKDDNRMLIKKPFTATRGPIKGLIFDKALTSLSSGPTWEVFIKC